ncbi:hypothetical protein RJ639_002978 [Escallonia herrerae]|uniref:Pentatricopeptide repeat-containing protein n=1 Tax=Escallonia herrerae TaxID=1293975 RepID=A0AA88W2U2_9ASTE|nr:hypothetical protein RJ639_002978 [Escallonia herrerae]
MIHILTKQGHFKAAQNMLEKIALRDFLSSHSVLSALVSTHDEPDVNAHVLSWLLIIYGNLKMTQDAIQVFEHMRAKGFRPHLHACTVLLNSLVKERLTDMAWKAYKSMIKAGVDSNIYVFNVLILACCKSGDVEKAEELLGEMELKGIFPDLFTYNTLISLYCKKGMHYEALCVQDRMERGGVCPDIVTVNELDEALRLRKEMEHKGLIPGVVTYNSILRKLCEESRLKDANKLLNEMGEKKIDPDNITCNTLINAHCKIGDMRSGLKVRRCCPSYCTYSWIVDGYCGQGNEEAVLKLPDEFVQRGLCVDISVYRALIRRFSRREKVDYAQRIFGTMQMRGISGDCVVYTSLAYAYLKAGKEAAASDLLDEMYHMRLIITIKIYRSFNASYAGDNNILAIFWDIASVKGLFSKTMFKHIQQLKVNA